MPVFSDSLLNSLPTEPSAASWTAIYGIVMCEKAKMRPVIGVHDVLKMIGY